MPDEDSHASDEEAQEKGFKIVDRLGASFSLSLATSALYHMGLVADPETGQPGEANLPVARQTIDTLVMLQEKTEGNLSDEEQGLLTNLLTELRMRFIEAAK